MGQLSFRPFNADQDGPLVTAFARDIFLCTFGDHRRFERKFGPNGEHYVPWLERGRRQAMLAYEGDTPVGLVVLGRYKPDPTFGYVFHYYLIEQARGRRLGDELDSFACQALRANGFPHARLAVSLTNIRAVRFYRRRGWTDAGPRPRTPGVHFFEKQLNRSAVSLGSGMVRYYFDVRKDGNVLRDDEGSEAESLDAAVHAAARSAAELGTGRLARGDFTDVVIEVRDERDQRVCTVTASMKIDRHDPPQPHP
jgi:GNAT superfamily N-acetyltransferase